MTNRDQERASYLRVFLRQERLQMKPFARRLQVDYRRFSEMLLGDRPFPPGVAEKFAKLLGVEEEMRELRLL